jgi:RNA recognition motif-containing protein
MHNIHSESGKNLLENYTDNQSLHHNEIHNPITLGSLFVSNLSINIKKSDLYELFADYGKILSIILKYEKKELQTNQTIDLDSEFDFNYAFVIFENIVDAFDAIEDLDEEEACLFGEPLK